MLPRMRSANGKRPSGVIALRPFCSSISGPPDGGAVVCSDETLYTGRDMGLPPAGELHFRRGITVAPPPPTAGYPAFSSNNVMMDKDQQKKK